MKALTFQAFTLLLKPSHRLLPRRNENLTLFLLLRKSFPAKADTMAKVNASAVV
ncbi:MAG: hypothetical protein MR971_06400 [Bacteroidales bacterium]|nr:hypothetical protein [Bacteroidales bacterium]